MASIFQITSQEISHWASTISARARLPVLLRKLINSTCPDIVSIDFPGNEESQRVGPDGLVDTNAFNQWVPNGQSIWEFGCNVGTVSKANQDYQKTVNQVKKDERQHKTFVFVTPRKWQNKNNWASQKRAERQFKDIRVYDANDLEQWLETSPITQFWFLNEIGRPIEGVESLEESWKKWSAVCDPPMSEKLFSKAVQANKERILNAISGTPKQKITINAHSVGEGVAFICQFFFENDEAIKSLRDSVIIIDKPEALRTIDFKVKDWIIITTSSAVHLATLTYANSFNLIQISSGTGFEINADETNINAKITLEIPDYQSFQDALLGMGFEYDKIACLANESGRSLTVLRRRLCNNAAIHEPEWADNQEYTASMIAFLFAGVWDAEYEDDKIALQLLADINDYSELERKLQRMASMDDAPVWSVGNYRGIVSKIDSLYAVHHLIISDDIKRFFKVAHLVLSKENPSMILGEGPPNNTILRSKKLNISERLSKSIGDTLCWLSEYGNQLFKPRLGIDINSRLNYLIGCILGETLTVEKLEENLSYLPLYAEAAPNKFLELLERDLRTTDPILYSMMKPEDRSGFGVNSPRVHLLWALECLAWSPTHFSRVVFILAKLSFIELDDNLSNKPIKTLKEIYRALYPQTGANLDDRVKTFEALKIRFPDIAWQIAIDQFLPHQRTTQTYRPQWRFREMIGKAPEKGHDFYKFIDSVIELLLSWGDYTKEQIYDLLCLNVKWNEVQQTKFLNIATNFTKGLEDRDRAWLQEKTRKIINHNKRTLAKSDVGASPSLEKETKWLCDFYKNLEPNDIVFKHLWLFSGDLFLEHYEEVLSGKINEQIRGQKIYKMRCDALIAINIERGIDGILKLADMSGDARLIGRLLTTDILNDSAQIDYIIRLLVPADFVDTLTPFNLILGAMESTKTAQRRQEIYKAVKVEISEADYVKFLQCCPFDFMTWGEVDNLNMRSQELYWVNNYAIWNRQTPSEINYAVKKLLEVMRHQTAYNFVRHNFDDLQSDTLYELLKALATNRENSNEHNRFNDWEIVGAFNILENKSKYTVKDMAVLEVLYIKPLCHSHLQDKKSYGIPNVEKYLRQKPEAFAQLVACAQIQNSGKVTHDLITYPKGSNADIYIRSTAYKILCNLANLFDLSGLNQAEASQLADWVHTARNLCALLGYESQGDSYIGKLLAHSPIGTDGIWPSEPVRDVLENIKSESMCASAAIWIRNSRGWVLREEGKHIERDLVKQYENWAKALSTSHPMVCSNILLKIVEHDNHQADYWELEDKKDRRFN